MAVEINTLQRYHTEQAIMDKALEQGQLTIEFDSWETADLFRRRCYLLRKKDQKKNDNKAETDIYKGRVLLERLQYEDISIRREGNKLHFFKIQPHVELKDISSRFINTFQAPLPDELARYYEGAPEEITVPDFESAKPAPKPQPQPQTTEWGEKPISSEEFTID